MSKLRSDSNLRHLFKGKQRKRKGRPKMYAGKVGLGTVKQWSYEGNLESHIEVYSIIVNSPRFAMNLKVVVLNNTKTNKQILLACTDLNLDVLKITDYYRLRFKIEFLFRDVKQFTGLTQR